MYFTAKELVKSDSSVDQQTAWLAAQVARIDIASPTVFDWLDRCEQMFVPRARRNTVDARKHELATPLVKGRKPELPPTNGYYRLGRIWVLPQARGNVRVMARATELPDPPKALREAGFSREPKSGYPQLVTSSEKAARDFIAFYERTLTKDAE